MLAKHLQNGEWLTRDVQAAIYWYDKAAQQGNAGAQNELGLIYFTGRDTEKNFSLALKLFQAAAASGQADAMNNLGAIYSTGEEIAQDQDKALMYFSEAAERGNSKSQLTLGLMYLEGIGVEQDFLAAEALLLKAAEAGDEGAQMHLGLMYTNRPFAEDTRVEGIKWLKIAARNGNEIANELLTNQELHEEETEPTPIHSDYQPTPMVQELPNGCLHLHISVEEHEWNSSTVVTFGELGCEKKSYFISADENSSVADIINSGFLEIYEAKDLKQRRTGVDYHHARHTVTIEWRTMPGPDSSSNAEFRLTYSSNPESERGYEYTGSVNDYYYRDDSIGVGKVKKAKLQLIRDSDLSDNEKSDYISIIEADSNIQLDDVRLP